VTMYQRSLSTLLIIGGVLIVLIGLLIRVGAFSWFGRLPGDISRQGEHVSIFVPITSMIVISLMLTLGLYLLRRFF